MSEPIVEPPPGDTGTAAPPAPQADPPAPAPAAPNGFDAPSPFALTGNLDFADPDD